MFDLIKLINLTYWIPVLINVINTKKYLAQ
jgi:hypothetical protein